MSPRTLKRLSTTAAILFLVLVPLVSVFGFLYPQGGAPTQSGGPTEPGAISAVNADPVEPFSGIIASSTDLTISEGNFLQQSPISPKVLSGHKCALPGYNFCSDLPLVPQGAAPAGIKVQGNYAYLVFNRSGVDALRILDISNPILPRVIGGFNLSSNMPAASGVDLAINGRYLYMIFGGSGSAGEGFRIIDIINPKVPFVVVGSGSIGGVGLPNATPADIESAGQYVYITFFADGNSSLRIVDVSNPAAPVAVGGNTIVNDSGNSSTNPSGAYPPTGPPGTGSQARKIAVNGKYALVTFNAPNGGVTSAFNNAFRIIDVSNPAMPKSVGGRLLSTSNGFQSAPIFYANAVVVSGRYAYLGFDANFTSSDANASLRNMLRIIDIANATAPAVVGGSGLADSAFQQANATYYPANLFVAGRYLYMSMSWIIGTEQPPYEQGKQLRVVDIADPANPQFIGGANLVTDMPFTNDSVTDGHGADITVSGRYAYQTFRITAETENPPNFPLIKSRIFRIIDISGLAAVSALPHSLETGSLQVVDDLLIQNQLTVRGGLSIGGDVQINGWIAKAGGTFEIDHPLDPAHKILRHSFVESPEMKNIYTGIAVLNQQGEAVIQLPDYFEALNRDFRYQFSAVSAPAPQLALKEPVRNNRFVIGGGPPGAKISWQVTGIRKDPWALEHPLIVEEKKETPGYLHPELYPSF